MFTILGLKHLMEFLMFLKVKILKTIVKLHNFRYDCTRSYFVYKHLGKKGICPKCGLNRKYFQIFNKYFKESYLKSFLVIYYGKKYFQILTKSNFKILVLTKFHKRFLINIGFDKTEYLFIQIF